MQLEPIAVVGIGCRFPRAKDPQAFWELIRDGNDGVSQVPESRWDVNSFYDLDPSKPGKANTKWGGFLEDIDLFDPQFFGIAPKEAITMDPQQRLLLEVAWETLEDAGQIPETLRGSNTGVFIGIGTHDYSIMMWQQPVNEPYATTGTGNCIAANRISYIFDFKGPSLAVDTACSSSLVAVHLACQSIWTGESTQALAGGVNMLLLPTIMVGFSKGGFMSSEGCCKSFAADADGYVRGEGAGLVLLKPLAQAEADGDDIYGVILSSAVNQDGSSNGMAAPNPEAQAAVLREAYRRGNIDPSQVDYIEAHGTGTKVGDPIEMQALGTVLKENRDSGDNCLVGSVKTNIGHTETAAGIAGIIKVALAFKHQQIPPSLHFDTPNPEIDFAESKLQVVTELTPWKKDRPMIAGVNSFGFGGTNAHVVMRQWNRVSFSKLSVEKSLGSRGSREVEKIDNDNLRLLTISAKSKAALGELAQGYQDLIQQGDIALKDICVGSNIKRSHFNHRLTCICKSKGQLNNQLAAFISGQESPGVIDSCVIHQADKICWMFTGQGSQYVGMGKQLYDTQPVFRDALDLCAEILKSYLDLPLLEIIQSSSINQTQYTQPAIFSIEYALAQLWLDWGIKPDYVIGHSIGEYVAACIAGVFSLKDGLKLVAQRGRLMGELPASGGMLAVFASVDRVAELTSGYEDISIAAINNQENIVISGKSDSLDTIEQKLSHLGISSTFLQVSHPFHSSLMQPILKDFATIAQQVVYHQPQIAMVSCVRELIEQEINNADYWVDHIIQPVRFADSFDWLLRQGIKVFLELGAKPILSSLGRTILNQSDNNDCVLLPSMSDKQPSLQVLFNTVARLYHQGIEIDWQEFNYNYIPRNIPLPTYLFQRQKYWWDKAKFWLKDNVSCHHNIHPLLGECLSLDNSLNKFQNQISTKQPNYIADHCLEDRAVFPATGYLEMMLAAVSNIYSDRECKINDFIINQPLFLDSEITIETVIKGDRIQISSNQDRKSILHSEAVIKTESAISFDGFNLETLKSTLQPEANINGYYQKLKQQGLNYGQYFQNIKQLWVGENKALGYIEISDDLECQNYQLHPALLDSCLQLIGTVTKSQSGLYLPVKIGSMQLYQPAGNKVWAQIEIKQNDSQALVVDIKIVDRQGKAIALINNLSLQYISSESLDRLINSSSLKNVDDINKDLYQITWSEQKLDPEHKNNLPNNWLIYGGDKKITSELDLQLTGNKILLSPDRKYQQIDQRQYLINPTQLEDWQQLWQSINNSESWGVIYIDDVSKTFNRASLQGCAVILHLIQTIPAQQLFIVTDQTQIKTNNLSSGVWGLGRAIALEDPKLKCVCLDLESNNISNIIQEINHNQNQNQIAYQNNKRYCAKLAPKDNTLNNPYRLQLSEYGTPDNLTLAPIQRRQPQPGEIEIAVTASGVNFRDVLNALGVLQEYLQTMGFGDATQVPFGGECAGVVVAVGEGVTSFEVGDKVIAAQAVGSLSSHVTVDARFAILKPEHLNDCEAATIPTTFLTAYYGLHYLAKIEAGDKILIHAAAGGVGQAAVQLAQQIGAEIYATASVGKWDYLKASGIKYIMNSRNTDFADEVMRLTEGEGVDLILNSLNGEFIPRNLDILAPQGRFVEIGKVGIWNRQQVAEKRSDVNYFPFDLLEVSQQNPDLIQTLFAEIRQRFINQQLQPLPHKVYPIQSANNAFRYMAQAKHIGKVVISFPANNSVVKADGCYLITGGLGALGLQVANWLAEEGAKNLILVGRSQPNENAQQQINKLKQQGVTVNVAQADITDYDALKNIITQSPSHPFPLHGIIHAAGILNDGLLKNLSWSGFEAVLQPKVMGAWNLHQLTKNLDLDWFVCFSSIVSVFGAVGQSNYAAANAYLDNLMSYRRNLGLPGLSINWSIWDEVGMATRMTTQQKQRLNQQGLTAIAPQQGLKVLKQLIQQQATQTIVFPVDWETFLNQQPANNFFEKLQPQIETQTETTTFVQQLWNLPPDRRHQTLETHIRGQIAKVLGYSDLEDIDPQEKFADLGMDSLMAVEFKNNLRTSFGNAVSLTAAFDYPTVELLSDYIAQELSLRAIDGETGRQGDRETGRQGDRETGRQGDKVTRRWGDGENKLTSNSSIASQLAKRSLIRIDPKYTQFSQTPEYLNLKQDLKRVEKLGNPFFSLHQGIARDTIKTDNRELINYSSYNYLGMSGDPTITAAAQKAIAEYGTSVSASRLLSGERPLHLELEQAIANLIGTEAAIVYVGGHATNVSTIGHLFGDRDLIICDALSHNSIREGCKLSGATIIDFPHNDCQALEVILERERTKYEKVLIAVEGIYSTDGDLAPLPTIVELKQYYQTFLLVDEAHSIGVLGLSGGGIREHYSLQPSDVDLWMGTLSKSLASCGGYIAGSKELIEYLKYTAPGFVFSVGMSPANTAAAIAAIKLLKSEPERAIKLQARAKFCLDLAKSKHLNTGYSANSPIIPIIVGEPHKAVRLSQYLIGQGINVNPMVYPSVPYDAARLRFFITSLHSESQIQSTINILAKAIA